MKKIIAIFSVLALCSAAAFAQDPPKNAVKKKTPAPKVTRFHSKAPMKAKKMNTAPVKKTQ